MVKYLGFLFLSPLFFASIFSCSSKKLSRGKVEIVTTDEGYRLMVNGKGFTTKGVGINWEDGHNFKGLSEAGGNSFRTWRTNHLEQELDSAEKYGFMVAVGIDLEKELHGFNYEDEEAVKLQFDRVRKIVEAYKGHPNILCWVLGNELNLLFDENGGLKLVNPKAYMALHQIVAFLHETDPNHPVTTTFAGVNAEHIALALKHCPDLDFLSFQVYGDLKVIGDLVERAKVRLPYMITEYGPTGHWERPTTAWGREIEEPSGLKARNMAARIESGIVKDKSGLQIGNFAFEWGQKQERTPTWYGMFNKSGEATARIDELTKFWTGGYPQNRAPLADSLLLDSRHAEGNIFLQPTTVYEAEVFVREPDGDSLTYQWVMLKEVDTRSQGGAFEREPEQVDFSFEVVSEGKIKLISPVQEGDYRLFVYVRDGNGKVANANVPFFVKPNKL